jgi:hypothetical protein
MHVLLGINGVLLPELVAAVQCQQWHSQVGILEDKYKIIFSLKFDLKI